MLMLMGHLDLVHRKVFFLFVLFFKDVQTMTSMVMYKPSDIITKLRMYVLGLAMA